MERTWESLFIEEAKLLGHSEEYIQLCLDYASILIKNNLPVIFDVEHLLDYYWTGQFPWANACCRFDWAYKDYQIRKKTGGFREISAPIPTLKWCQHWIQHNILEHIVDRLSSSVHGFVQNRSIQTNALPHVNSEWIINIDLKDYFDSISQKKVLDFFLQLGYEDSVSEFLSNVCTRFSHVTYQRALPQGAPTSPLLANFLTINLDKDLERLAEELDMRYTRYADDITFSGVQKTCPVTPRDIENIIYEHGFRPNKSKTRIRYKGSRMMVTGLTVGNGVHVPKEYRKQVLRELHFAKKYGPENHCRKVRNEKGYFREWLLGRIMFVRSIDKEAGTRMLEIFNDINWMM